MSLLDNYRHVTPIGGGYFAIVKQYEDIAGRQKVAIKELKSEFKTNAEYITRFKREIRLLNELAGHPNVVELIASEVTEQDFRYVMPLATENLENFMRHHNNNLGIEGRIAIFDQILSAIKFAHSKNILHRDLNPNNVLIFAEGESTVVKVADFGLGKSLESLSAQTHSHVTEYGQVWYTAPEQFEHLNQATTKSDIYSLGKVLDFVLTGRTPRKVQSTDFSTVVGKAVEDDPDKRYQNIDEFEEDYKHIKGLVLATPDSIPVLLKEYASSNKPIDWHQFHRLALAPVDDTDEHIYYAYLEPVVTVLNDEQNLNAYYLTVGTSIEDFVAAFLRHLQDCIGSTGWPFSNALFLARFVKSLFDLNVSDQVNLSCLTQLWDMAYAGDLWKAQDMVKDIFRQKKIPKGIEVGFASIISRGRKSEKMKQLLMLSPPPVVREAIKQKMAEDKAV